MDPAPYTANQVHRNTVFTYDARRQVYELTDPAGWRWIMQSWGQSIDIRLSLGDLGGLASRLALPPDWTYQTRTPIRPLRVDTTIGDADVILDDLGNLCLLVTDSQTS